MLQMGDLTLLPDGTAFLSSGAQIGRALYLVTVAYVLQSQRIMSYQSMHYVISVRH